MLVASLFFSGCTSIMKKTSLIIEPNKKKAIVNFIRPSVFYNDGIDVSIWDGETYIGELGAGEIIQKEVEAGKHLFISRAYNWSYASGNLIAGKHYFIKPNPFWAFGGGRFALGVAKSNDKRVDEWLGGLTPIVIGTEEDRKRVEVKQKKKIQKAISDFEEGRVSRFATIGSKNIHPILSEIEDRY